VHRQALACLLVGILATTFEDDDSPGGYNKYVNFSYFNTNRDSIAGTILQKIGAKKMKEKFAALTTSDKWQKVAQRIVSIPELMDKMPNDLVPFNFYDELFLIFFSANADSILKHLAQQNEPTAVSPPPINIPKAQIPSPQTTAHSPQLLRQLETDLENAKQENRQLVAKIQNMERTYQDLSNKITLVDVELTKSKAREIDAEQLENELRQENNKLEVQLNAKDSEISKLTKEFNMRIQVMESQTQNMEFNTKQKLEEYNSLVNAYDVLENVVKDKDKELEILKNNQKSLEQKLKEKANASNQVTELEMQLQQSQLRENEISQKLEAREIEFEALRNQFLMFQQEANNQTNTALNSQKQEFSEIESGLIQRIASLEKQLAEKTKKVEEQEHDNDDMMDIIMKLEEKLARLQSGAPLEDENA
jgi:hypothetical protein